jgi:hypothetical protein
MSTPAVAAQDDADVTKPCSRSIVLADQDLLAIVFTNILPNDPADLPRCEIVQGRKQLRDAALTCKSFKDPALDRLWMSLDSLLPLIKTLPNVIVIDGVHVSEYIGSRLALKTIILCPWLTSCFSTPKALSPKTVAFADMPTIFAP